MTSPASLARIRFVSRLCRRSAWVIAAVGIVVIAILAVTLYNLFTQPLQSVPGPHLNELFVTLAIALLMALPISFFALILSALGAWLEYLCNEQDTREAGDEESVEITSLPEYEEIRKL